jgi:DNA replication protein DnaC
MNTDQTLKMMRTLSLNGMADRYEVLLNISSKEGHPDGHTLLAMLLDAEQSSRKRKKTELIIQQAQLRYKIAASEISCSAARGLSAEQWLYLCECKFVEEAVNVIILGPTGVGKSAVACALARQACTLGIKTLYFSTNKLIEEVANAKLKGTYLKFLNKLAKMPLLIMDDFGLKALDTDSRLALYEILEDRVGKGAIIVTSQYPVTKWYEKLGDPTLAEAILDRMAGRAEKINLSGDSRRKKQLE